MNSMVAVTGTVIMINAEIKPLSLDGDGSLDYDNLLLTTQHEDTGYTKRDFKLRLYHASQP